MNGSMDPELYQIIGEHKADITSLKQDLKEIKDNQKVFIEFVTEQKAGRKYVWIIFASVAGLISFGKDIIAAISGIFTLKGLH